MSLTPDQSAAVSSWIAAGDNLSAVQKKLREQFAVSLTFMEVRFLVDDLNLQLKDPAPKADASDLSKSAAPAARKAAAPEAGAEPAGEAELLPNEGLDDGAALPAEDAVLEDEGGAPGGSISVEVDKVTLHPGALASGTVTFSDGVTGKWIVDNYGRPGFTEVSQPGYRPKPDDAQAFMQELSLQLQKRGY